MIVCSTTAFIILISGAFDPDHPNAIAGASLTQSAVEQNFGVLGQWFMTAMVFPLSSVLGNYAVSDAAATGSQLS
jgi:alanine or glycine:cation symporter, AGCS family